MVGVRLDPNLASRIDASDVVQDTLLIAHRRLEEYLRDRSISFYGWLRNLAWQRLIDLQRRHVYSQRRSIHREDPFAPTLSDDSFVRLANLLSSDDASPSQQFLKNEMTRRLKTAMTQLGSDEREVLVLRHLEELSVKEITSILSIPEGTIQSRHFRAVQKLRRILDDE
jgi:RNA polymerase sigma-70 factor (ECF subfamily)